MSKQRNINDQRYLSWLLVTGLIGGFCGWCIYGLITDNWNYLYLPILILSSILFTLNGDNIIESIMVVIIFGLIALGLGTSETIISKIGRGIVPSFYGALAISKIIFALVKEGMFGNKRFP